MGHSPYRGDLTCYAEAQQRLYLVSPTLALFFPFP